MSYELYGLREDIIYSCGHPLIVEVKELIATFDTEELAKEYVRKSSIQKKKAQTRYRIQGMRYEPVEYRYKDSSLLRLYGKCEIVFRKKTAEPQHNPTL